MPSRTPATPSSTTPYPPRGPLSALDRFVNFFISPLLTAGALEREVRAVDSEDQKNHNIDAWRLRELCRTFVVDEHPQSRYGNGNYITLWERPQAAGRNVRDALNAFYQKYYVAEAMCLAVYTCIEPQEVINAITPALLQVRSGKTVPNVFCPEKSVAEIYRPEVFGRWYSWKPTDNRPALVVSIPFPSAYRNYRAMSGTYCSYIVGHECDGSILDVLKRKGYATSLVAGSHDSALDQVHGAFQVRISLSDEGVAHVAEVLSIVFQFLSLLTNQPVDATLLREALAVRQAEFALANIADPENHTIQLVIGASFFGLAHAWSGLSVLHDSPETARAVAAEELTYLRADRCVVIFRRPDSTIETVDRWEGLPEVVRSPLTCQTTFCKAPYTFSQMSMSTIQQWAHPATVHPWLHLPHENPFAVDLAEKFIVFSESASPKAARVTLDPPLCVSSPRGDFWWRADDGRYKMPTAAFYLELQSPACGMTALDRFFTSVLKEIVKHTLTETLYFAELGCMPSSLQASVRGIAFSTSGLTKKMSTFILIVLRHILVTANHDKSLFELYASKVRKELDAVLLGQPYTLAAERMRNWLYVIHFDPSELLASRDVTRRKGL